MKIAIMAKFPKSTWIKETRLEALNALRKAGTGIRQDFDKTVETWETRPKFEQKISLAGGNPKVTVWTTDTIYGYVSSGTKPHKIVPRSGKFLAFRAPYTPKTSIGVIGSSAGSRGNELIFAKEVTVEIKARNFDKVIAEKWEPEFVRLIHEAISKGLAKAK